MRLLVALFWSRHFDVRCIIASACKQESLSTDIRTTRHATWQHECVEWPSARYVIIYLRYSIESLKGTFPENEKRLALPKTISDDLTYFGPIHVHDCHKLVMAVSYNLRALVILQNSDIYQHVRISNFPGSSQWKN